MKNPFKPDRQGHFSSPPNQSKGILDDYATRKVVSTREGTIEKVPVNDNDITNKKYVDAAAGGQTPTWGDVTASGAGLAIYGGVKAVSGAVAISVSGGFVKLDGDVAGQIVYGGDAAEGADLKLYNDKEKSSKVELSAGGLVLYASGANGVWIDSEKALLLTASGADIYMPTAEGNVGDVLKIKDGSINTEWSRAVPVGTIVMYGAATPPTEWLGCWGQEVSRTTYAALFAVIGTLFGIGDGSTTFNVPNFNTTFAKGLGSGGAPGPTGGSTTYTHVPLPTPPQDWAAGAGGMSDGHYADHTGVEPPYLSIQFIIKT